MSFSVFTPMYEAVIGANPFNPEYRDGIFSSVGILSIVVAATISLLFYVALGRWKPVFHKLVHWVITLILIAVIGFALAYTLTNSEIGAIDAYALRFALMNMFYVAVYFMVLSVVLKHVSIFAKHTPF